MVKERKKWQKIVHSVFVFLMILSSALFLYHVWRVYIFKADCDYIISRLNYNIESTLILSVLLNFLISIAELISNIMQKHTNGAKLAAIGISLMFIFGLITFYNTFMECFLHDVDLFPNGIRLNVPSIHINL